MMDMSVRLKLAAKEHKKGFNQKIMLPAVRAGARVIIKKARENVMALDDPETKRHISKNIASRYRRKKSLQTGKVIVSVGVLYPKGRIPKGNPDDGVNTPHWHLLELGTEKMRARPFLVPAAVSSMNKVMSEIVRVANRQLDKEQW